ncbi:DUF1349 domain-containing protein [Streptomyces sp. HNM0574]|uniref:DUF1349 domain-containing protein n=1 Tax=Streptomyces sp. HNM0574 TaxID=2714954 RepID=UPI00146DB621|nr:DUF1349 domain-containing protein [Streptomyces sp. HNM0574]
MTGSTELSWPDGTDAGDPWQWRGTPAATSRDGRLLRIEAPGGADLYALPGSYEADGLPLLQRPVRGDFTASARIAVEGGAFGDAAGLALHGEDGWLKVCVERTRAGGWAVVTVHSRPASDEAMGPALAGPAADLLLTREGRRHAVFFRQEPDGDWQFVRTFHGFAADELRLGLFVQAPFSPSAAGAFTPVRISATPLGDRR